MDTPIVIRTPDFQQAPDIRLESRVRLSKEEAERRNRECKKRYYEKNKDLLREKARAVREANPEYNTQRKEKYQETIQHLINAGIYQAAKRGRKPLYETPEEAHEIKKQQMRVSYARRKERISEAMATLAQMKLKEAQGMDESEQELEQSL